MKSLKDFIFEAKKEDWQNIFDHCRSIQGETNSDDANDCIRLMKEYFTSRNYETITYDEFIKQFDDEGFYFVFDNENWLMCKYDYNKFIASTVQKGQGNRWYVNGNLYYAKSELKEFIKLHYDGPKMKIWSGGF